MRTRLISPSGTPDLAEWQRQQFAHPLNLPPAVVMHDEAQLLFAQA